MEGIAGGWRDGIYERKVCALTGMIACETEVCRLSRSLDTINEYTTPCVAGPRQRATVRTSSHTEEGWNRVARRQTALGMRSEQDGGEPMLQKRGWGTRGPSGTSDGQ